MSNTYQHLTEIQGYSYTVWKYSVGHSTLTIRAVHEDKSGHNIHITFVNVHYVQFPISWKGDLYLASDKDLLNILIKAGFEESIKKMPLSFLKENWLLYTAETPMDRVYILGKLGSVEQNVEPIYN